MLKALFPIFRRTSVTPATPPVLLSSPADVIRRNEEKRYSVQEIGAWTLDNNDDKVKKINTDQESRMKTMREIRDEIRKYDKEEIRGEDVFYDAISEEGEYSMARSKQEGEEEEYSMARSKQEKWAFTHGRATIKVGNECGLRNNKIFLVTL